MFRGLHLKSIHYIDLILFLGRPELLQFPPYNKDQIIEILHERLKDVSVSCHFCFLDIFLSYRRGSIGLVGNVIKTC